MPALGKGSTQTYPKPGVSTSSMMSLQSESSAEEVLKRMQEEIKDLKRDNSRIQELLQTSISQKDVELKRQKLLIQTVKLQLTQSIELLESGRNTTI